MSATVEKLSQVKSKITITVDADTFEKSMEKAFRKTMKRYNIPGFRKGHAPRTLVERYYGSGVLYEDAFEIAFPDAYEKALEETGLKPISRPELDVEQIEKGKDLIFTAIVYEYPEVQLGDYKSIHAEKVVDEVTDDDVNAEIERERDRIARYVDVTDRPVKLDDEVNIDYKGFCEGEQFEGGTAEKYSLTLGSGTFIPGFEDQVICHKIGENFDVKVKFPDDYHAENLKGKDAVFSCLIHEIKVKELPAEDDEFAKDLGEFDTFEEYKNGIKERLKADELKKAETAENDALIEAVVKATELKVPDAMIDDEVTRNLEDMKHSMSMYGLKFEDYLQYTSTTEEKIREDIRPRAENEVKTGMIMNAIITKEKLVPTPEELKAELKKRAGAAEDAKEEDYMKDVNEYELNSLMQRMTFDKLIAFLRANNNIA